MQWSDVAETVGKVAPVVGAALGGPAGAAVGGLVSRALGVANSPEALAGVTANADQRIELERIEQEHKREILSLTLNAQAKAEAEQTARLSEVNATMRAELSHEGWFKSGWRPGLGWIFALSLGVLACVLASIMARDPTLVSDPEFTGMLAWLFVTMGAALGINVRDRSKDKRVAMTGEMPASFFAEVLTRTKK